MAEPIRPGDEVSVQTATGSYRYLVRGRNRCATDNQILVELAVTGSWLLFSILEERADGSLLCYLDTPDEPIVLCRVADEASVLDYWKEQVFFAGAVEPNSRVRLMKELRSVTRGDRKRN